MKNGFNNKLAGLFLMFWILLAVQVHAQPNLVFYPLNNQFNSFEYNPAFLTSSEKFTFSIVPVAYFNMSFNNQDIVKDMVSELRSGEITTQESRDIFTRMLRHPSFRQNVEGSWLNFTYRTKKGFLNFNISDRQFFSTSLKGELLDFLFRSDIRSTPIGRSQKVPFQGAHYREYSLGYAYTSRSKRLSAGVKAKLYFGKFAFYGNVQGSINNLSNNYAVTTAGIAHISLPEEMIESSGSRINRIDLSKKNILTYFWNSGNPGLGMDLGIHYKVNPRLSVSASMVNLGKINWKNEVNSRSMVTQFYFPPGTYVPDTLAVPILIKRDTLSYAGIFHFSRLERDSAAFSRALPLHLYAGIKYQVNPGLSISLTDRYTVIKNLSYNSLTLLADFNVNPKLTLSTGYAMIGDAYFNLPLGLLLKQNFGQVYVGTDNLISFLVPSQADLAAFSIGACFYLFTHRNLLLKRDENTPFYQPRKTIKNQGSGFIIKARKKD
ncbi:MAG TPA: DUF5723 family protein [Prolixibacteraceae bacterium]|nr:DUF5723 family protein [Prolixibacteraceae bacterium]